MKTIEKPTHTPGPWEVNQDSPGTLDVNKTSHGVRSRIARIHVEHLADEHGGNIPANARLIASAPDLLAALKTAEMAMLGYLVRNPIMENAIVEARAAIAKATGGQP